jgi:hypothetical protein
MLLSKDYHEILLFFLLFCDLSDFTYYDPVLTCNILSLIEVYSEIISMAKF